MARTDDDDATQDTPGAASLLFMGDIIPKVFDSIYGGWGSFQPTSEDHHALYMLIDVREPHGEAQRP